MAGGTAPISATHAARPPVPCPTITATRQQPPLSGREVNHRMQGRPSGHVNSLQNWCRRRDSNSHSFRHYPLKIACLPISPRRHVCNLTAHRSWNPDPTACRVTTVKHRFTSSRSLQRCSLRCSLVRFSMSSYSMHSCAGSLEVCSSAQPKILASTRVCLKVLTEGIVRAQLGRSSLATSPREALDHLDAAGGVAPGISSAPVGAGADAASTADAAGATPTSSTLPCVLVPRTLPK